jgi:hypothetical protein
MTVAKWTVSLALVAAAGSIVLVCALTDVRQLIRERYPSAEVTVHEGHSPGVRPVLSTMRLLRGSHFVPENEWVELELTDESKPVGASRKASRSSLNIPISADNSRGMPRPLRIDYEGAH